MTIPLTLRVVSRGVSGRVLALEIAGSGSTAPVVLRLDRIRRTLRRLPSTLFVMRTLGAMPGASTVVASVMEPGCPRPVPSIWATAAGARSEFFRITTGTVYGPLKAPVQDP